MPAYVMTVSKGGLKLKEAERAAEAGSANCDGDPSAAPKGTHMAYLACKQETMKDVAQLLQNAGSDYFNNKIVADETGLDKVYEFKLHWTPRSQVAFEPDNVISILDAADQQLGLKLELKTAPRSVHIIDAVNETASVNPEGWEKLLPPIPPPAFDVVVIRPSKEDEQPNGRVNGGQVATTALTLRFLFAFAWDLNQNDKENIANAPKWLDTDKWDIDAKSLLETTGKNSQQPGD